MNFSDAPKRTSHRIRRPEWVTDALDSLVRAADITYSSAGYTSLAREYASKLDRYMKSLEER